MCLWALKSGNCEFHSQLYYLLMVCPCTGAFPCPHCFCLCPSACSPALHRAGSFVAFMVQLNIPA